MSIPVACTHPVYPATAGDSLHPCPRCGDLAVFEGSEASRAAFDAMAETEVLLGWQWNDHVDAVFERRFELFNDTAYRTTYDAVILATEPAAKAVAIRRHLRAWGARRAEGVG